MGVLADLMRVPIDYMLEVSVDSPLVPLGVLSSITLPSPPTSIAYQRDGAVIVEYTMGDRPIRDFGSMKSGRISITGVAGTYDRSTYTSIGSAGGVVFKGGQESVSSFQSFLEKYHDLGLGEGLAGAAIVALSAPKLTFRAIKEDIHVNVEVLSFQQNKQVQGTRHFPAWKLDLQVWGDASTPWGVKNILGDVADAFEDMAAAVDQISNGLAIADNVLVNLRGDLEVLRAPMKAVLRAADALNNVVDSARTLARFPGDMVSDFMAAALSINNVWGTLRETLDLLDPSTGGNLNAEWERIKKILGWAIWDAVGIATFVAGMNGVEPGASSLARLRAGVAEGTWTTTRRPTRAARRRRLDDRAMYPLQLQAGEDLRDLAMRFYQDRERWHEIAEYNGWLSAHVTGTGVSATAGTVVLIPLGIRIAVNSGGPSDTYKTDLKVDLLKGDLVVDSAQTGFLRITGTQNLVQGLSMRFITVQGDSDPFPSFGMPEIVGEKNTSAMLGLIGAHAREQALRDSRIKDVLGVELLAEGSTASVQLSAVPVGEAPPVTLIAPLRTG